MSEKLDRLTEGLKAIPGNLGEMFGGVAAPFLVGLTAVTFVTILTMAAVRLRPRHRIGYAMVPDPNFDPTQEEIIRYSAGLAEARNAIGFATNSHRMVRLTLCSDDEGKLVSLIGINPRARSVAERNGYGRVELVDPAEVLGELAPAWLPPVTPDVDESPSEPDVSPPGPIQDTIVDMTEPPSGQSPIAVGARKWESVL